MAFQPQVVLEIKTKWSEIEEAVVCLYPDRFPRAGLDTVVRIKKKKKKYFMTCGKVRRNSSLFAFLFSESS